MKKKLMLMTLLAGTALFAETHFSVGVGVGAPGYYPPSPGVAADGYGNNGAWGNGYWAPPDYGYVAPPPVYYAPPPAYYAPHRDWDDFHHDRDRDDDRGWDRDRGWDHDRGRGRDRGRDDGRGREFRR